MNVAKATARYEAWLGEHLTLVARDLGLKHRLMREEPFAFLRATFYRWAQRWPEICDDLTSAPKALAVGDLHVENFGTWRDADGRLIWGINDFDEAWRLPYTNDLVRLATSAGLAASERRLATALDAAADAILEGYRACLDAGGRPFVLAEGNPALRVMAVHRLHEPEQYWEKLTALPTVRTKVPKGALRALERLMPEPGLPRRIVHRIAGLGSLGRQRFVALAQWRGGLVAREAKALAPSASIWAREGGGTSTILYQRILNGAVRCADPFVRLQRRWIVRRLAPDCSRIELAALPGARDERRLLKAMGWETANIHLGSVEPRRLRADLARRRPGWLRHAARHMHEAVLEDWKAWRRS